MARPRDKRRYRNSLDQIEDGFRGCWQNAQDLVSASDVLMASELHAPALSLSVLALEELAKLMAIDGLLFCRSDDPHAETFTTATQRHEIKLSLLEVFPLLLANLARSDPRYGEEMRFNQALVISIEQMKSDGSALMSTLRGDGFHDLDTWKQRGFYVGPNFVPPRATVPRELAVQVRQLAWRATTTLDFLLKGGSLERYIANARTVRNRLSEDQHRELESLAQQFTDQMFPDRDGGGAGGA
jgi:AbiV family abortive infection protein